MTGPHVSPIDAPAEDWHAGLLGALPLGFLTGALFLGAYVTYADYRSVGPGNYPLWGLFLTLGFVAAIGTVVSWFFATDELESAPSPPEHDSSDRTRSGRISESEFGRPAPEIVGTRGTSGPSSGVGAAVVTASASVEPWDEDVLPPAVARGPRPVLTSPYDPGDIGRALEEIADIQRDLAARRPSSVPGSEATARA
jgi:hypothetical protein